MNGRWPENYDNRPEQDGPYTLLRDGKEVITGTWAECIGWVHRNTPYSFDHATKYEGWRIADGRPWPKGPRPA